MNFIEFKTEILRRAHDAEACKDEYKRAYNSEDFEQLITVIKDNFGWCCKEKVLTPELLESVKEDAAKFDLYCNVTTNKGYLLAWGSATVEAWDSATVRASGSATVRAYGSATVRASGSAYINVTSTMECKISDKAIMRYRDTNQVITTNQLTHSIAKAEGK